MINGNDVQLFHALLDSLSTSLRDMAVKYELLQAGAVRESSEREKTNAAITALAKEVSSSFSILAKDVDRLKELSSEGRDYDEKVALAMQSLIKTAESIDAKMDIAIRESSGARTVATEGKGVSVHMDTHMDGFALQLASLQAMQAQVVQISKVAEEIKDQFEPVKKLAVLFSKPVAILVGIYVIVTTVIAGIEGCDQVNKLRDKLADPISVASTNVVHK